MTTTLVTVLLLAFLPGCGDPATKDTESHVILFGGSPANSDQTLDALSDMWIWDGVNWIELTPESTPPARLNTALARDSVRGRLVLFGGHRGIGYLNDTWEWDGSTWTEVSPAQRPPRLGYHAVAYDESRQRVVLFGGSESIGNGFAQDYGGTWEWDGTAWADRTSALAPPARTHHALVYDIERRTTLIFGGFTAATTSVWDDTWVWDGASWTELRPASRPSARFGHAIAYDAGSDRVLLFGGFLANGLGAADTWSWDGTNWTQLSAALDPPRRGYVTMAFDTDRNRLVLFGGSGGGQTPTIFGDTWEWDGTTWFELRPPLSPPARKFHAITSW